MSFLEWWSTHQQLNKRNVFWLSWHAHGCINVVMGKFAQKSLTEELMNISVKLCIVFQLGSSVSGQIVDVAVLGASLVVRSLVMADELFGVVVDAPAAQNKLWGLIELTCSWMHKFWDGQIRKELLSSG
jgi:hypothetical protein